MNRNVGGIDRIARIVVGLILIGLAFSDALGATHTIGGWGWIGLIPLVTGLLSWCPLYLPLGFSSKGKDDSPAT